jgi:hypothetical protein
MEAKWARCRGRSRFNSGAGGEGARTAKRGLEKTPAQRGLSSKRESGRPSLLFLGLITNKRQSGRLSSSLRWSRPLLGGRFSQRLHP